MFKRANRYSFKKSIPSKVFQTPYFAMRFDNDSSVLSCAVVVGKKVDKSAVVRNRIKRMIVLQIQEFVPLETKARIVLFVRKQEKKKEKEVIKEELEKALKTTKIV